jgi:hypothetical protein
LLNTPVKRIQARLLLGGMRLMRRRPDLAGCRHCPLDSWLGEIFPNESDFNFAAYIGTQSVFVKDTIQCMDSRGRILAFLKVPRGSAAAGMVRHEAGILYELSRRFPDQDFYPKLLGQRDGQFLQAPPTRQGPDDPGFILERLASAWSESIRWAESPVRKKILESLPRIRDAAAPHWADSLESAVARLDRQLGNSAIAHPLSHGDFIRWNLLPGPFAFDWEWAAPRLPWHDAFHYLWMPLFSKPKPPAFGELWQIWQGPAGTKLRSKPPESDSLSFALSYLASQFAFYAHSRSMDVNDISSNVLLRKIDSTLAESLKSL